MCGEGPGGQFCFKNLPLSLRNMSVNLSIFFSCCKWKCCCQDNGLFSVWWDWDHISCCPHSSHHGQARAAASGHRGGHKGGLRGNNLENITKLCFQYFQKDMPKIFESDPDVVFNMAFLLKINQKKMKRLEKVGITYCNNHCESPMIINPGVHEHEVQGEGGRDRAAEAEDREQPLEAADWFPRDRVQWPRGQVSSGSVASLS